MSIDPNRFFREITHTIMNNLDIEQSLFDLFQYLKQIIPLDHISIGVIDKRQISLHYLAEADAKGGRIIDEFVQHSEAVIAEGLVINMNRFKMFEDRSKSPFSRATGRYFGVEDAYSLAGMAVDIGGPLVGFFGIMAFGRKRYQQSHIDLLQTINELLSGHVVHILHDREIVLSNERLANENEDLWNRLGHPPGTMIVGNNLGLKKVMKQVNQVAQLRSPVLLIGETGTGKEVVANAVHNLSNRSKGPLVSVNCGAIPETLLESELFGYEKGAFTNATQQKKGYFERAHNGTIFLDEIGELSLQAQVKLLRVLQDMKLERIGGSQTIVVNTRIITATNRELPQMIQERRFREDLWFRLNVFPIQIPPLRERRQDIPELLRYFSSQKVKEMNLTFFPRFAPTAIRQLQGYNWPGNVRELQNVIERAIILSQGAPMSFPNLNTDRKAGGINYDEGKGSFPTMDEVIVDHIQNALVLSKGQIEGKGGAAELLNMHASTLRGRMRKFGIKSQAKR